MRACDAQTDAEDTSRRTWKVGSTSAGQGLAAKDDPQRQEGNWEANGTSGWVSVALDVETYGIERKGEGGLGIVDVVSRCVRGLESGMRR